MAREKSGGVAAEFRISPLTMERIGDVQRGIARMVEATAVWPNRIRFGSEEAVREFFALPPGRTFNHVAGLEVVVDPDVSYGGVIDRKPQ